jgi:cell division protein FtsB
VDEKDKKIKQQKDLIDKLADERQKLKRQIDEMKGVIVKLGDQR